MRTIRINNEDHEWLKNLAKITHRSLTFYLSEAIKKYRQEIERTNENLYLLGSDKDASRLNQAVQIVENNNDL